MVKTHSAVMPLLLTMAVVAVAAQTAQPAPEPQEPRLVCPRQKVRFGVRPAPHPMLGTLQGFLG